MLQFSVLNNSLCSLKEEQVNMRLALLNSRHSLPQATQEHNMFNLNANQNRLKTTAKDVEFNNDLSSLLTLYVASVYTRPLLIIISSLDLLAQRIRAQIIQLL
jgi:hypothetical protein